MEWFYPNDSRYYHGGKVAVDFHNLHKMKRKQQYPLELEAEYDTQISSFRENGYITFQNAISHDIIDSINEQTERMIRDNVNLKMHDQHYAMVADPFLNVNEAFNLAFSDHMLKFAIEYFDCMPGIGTFNLRKSYVNDLAPKTTQLFHYDRQNLQFFKFFIYMDDVDSPEDGPLTLVKGSNKMRPPNHSNKHRWTEQEMKNLYGEDSLVYLTAKKGDLIAAATTCYHRGTKPTRKERTMLTLNYVTHPEGSGTDRPGQYEKRFKMKESQYEGLADWKRPAADFLDKV
jgi:hypothetical protein